jgi:hypothetical protein
MALSCREKAKSVPDQGIALLTAVWRGSQGCPREPAVMIDEQNEPKALHRLVRTWGHIDGMNDVKRHQCQWPPPPW